MFPNDAGTAHTRAGRRCRLPATSPTAISRLGCRTGNGPRTSPRDQGRGREGRASRRRSTDTMAGSSRTRPVPVPTPGSPTGCSSRPWKRCRRERIPWCVPTADATAGGPDGWISWTVMAWHGRRVDWLQCIRQSDEGRMTWDWRPTMADPKHPPVSYTHLRAHET